MPHRKHRTEDDVFLEVTGISEDEFRFLRDGGDYWDEAHKRTEHFAGGLFDETVFNDSVREFMAKRAELANYFDESHDEDIFDYIPPQKTNQIFTPRWVVKKMVDALEEENPGCFDDPRGDLRRPLHEERPVRHGDRQASLCE